MSTVAYSRLIPAYSGLIQAYSRLIQACSGLAPGLFQLFMSFRAYLWLIKASIIDCPRYGTSQELSAEVARDIEDLRTSSKQVEVVATRVSMPQLQFGHILMLTTTTIN